MYGGTPYEHLMVPVKEGSSESVAAQVLAIDL